MTTAERSSPPAKGTGVFFGPTCGQLFGGTSVTSGKGVRAPSGPLSFGARQPAAGGGSSRGPKPSLPPPASCPPPAQQRATPASSGPVAIPAPPGGGGGRGGAAAGGGSWRPAPNAIAASADAVLAAAMARSASCAASGGGAWHLGHRCAPAGSAQAPGGVAVLALGDGLGPCFDDELAPPGASLEDSGSWSFEGGVDLARNDSAASLLALSWRASEPLLASLASGTCPASGAPAASVSSCPPVPLASYAGLASGGAPGGLLPPAIALHGGFGGGGSLTGPCVPGLGSMGAARPTLSRAARGGGELGAPPALQQLAGGEASEGCTLAAIDNELLQLLELREHVALRKTSCGPQALAPYDQGALWDGKAASWSGSGPLPPALATPAAVACGGLALGSGQRGVVGLDCDAVARIEPGALMSGAPAGLLGLEGPAAAGTQLLGGSPPADLLAGKSAVPRSAAAAVAHVKLQQLAAVQHMQRILQEELLQMLP